MLEKVKKKTIKLLRWSEKYTKTDMVYLAKGGGWLTVDNIVTAVITFGIAIAFANLVPKDIYGTYKFVLSVAAILAIPTLQGMKTSLTKAVAQGFDGSVFTVLKERLRWGVLSTLGSFGVSGYYLWQGNQELAFAFAIIALLIPLYESYALFQPFLHGKKRFDTAAQYDIASRVFAGIILVSTIFITNNLFWILFSYFGSWATIRAILFYKTANKFTENEKVDNTTISYGKHLSVMGIIGATANQIDKILVFHFLGPVEVAIYTFALAPVDQIKGLVKPIHSLAMPKFSARPENEVRSTLFSKIWKLVLVLIIPVGIYILIAPYFFDIFFPEYMESVPLSQVLALSLIVVGNLPKTFLEAKEKVRKRYMLGIFSGISKISLIAVFTFLYGLWGTIFALVIDRVITFLYSLWLVRKD